MYDVIQLTRRTAATASAAQRNGEHFKRPQLSEHHHRDGGAALRGQTHAHTRARTTHLGGNAVGAPTVLRQIHTCYAKQNSHIAHGSSVPRAETSPAVRGGSYPSSSDTPPSSVGAAVVLLHSMGRPTAKHGEIVQKCPGRWQRAGGRWKAERGSGLAQKKYRCETEPYRTFWRRRSEQRKKRVKRRG